MMDQELAEDILGCLLAAASELDEAKALAALVEDQDEDAASLKKLILKMNSELLQTIYDRFPDMLPFEEFPAISSVLSWEEVRLPPPATEAAVDEIVFSLVRPWWQKMALVVVLAVKQGEERALRVTDEMFAARIQKLAEMGRFESQGDLCKWRHSEVRLKE